jgi:uncharacterized protein YqfB (UPF0267 family)
MPAINFSMFVDKLISGQKTVTIRKSIPRGLQVGKTCRLYTGMFSKNCKLLGEVLITRIRRIYIEPCYMKCDLIELDAPEHAPDFERLEGDELLNLIYRDGFESEQSFFDYHAGKEQLEEKYLIEFEPLKNDK